MEVFLKVILPVFLVIGTGYLSVWHKWLNAKNIDSFIMLQGYAGDLEEAMRRAF